MINRARSLAAILALGTVSLIATPASARGPEPAPVSDRDWSHRADLAKEPIFAAREADWRNGPIVYQVLVDRFAPPEDLEAKRDLYPAPKTLRTWDETPTRGTFVDEVKVWSHEIDFWGGDLKSLLTRLDHVENLGADVLYLNPIHLAYTNHKYDAQDYFEISPEFGTRDDVRNLAFDLENRDMKLVLDGVFNHMGRTSPAFQDALENPDSPWREWFNIGPEWKFGYRAWVNVENLPEVNLESETVRRRIYGDWDSVIRGYLRDGVDGWRLDVAFDIGPRWLEELTRSAHAEEPGSVVIGELWNYPSDWFPAVDGTMNMPAREIILRTARGEVDGAHAARLLDTMTTDAGVENLLKSWIILDNHDTPRLATSVPDPAQRRMAQVLQFTVPGAPCVYYGVEVGMTGGDDPEQRGPMRWDLATSDNAEFVWFESLAKLRRESRALRIGDFHRLETRTALGFMRSTDRVRDTVIVLANPSEAEVTEFFLVPESKLMSYTKFRDAFSETELTLVSATLTVTMAPRSFLVLRPVIEETVEYSPYKRVR